MKKISSRLLTCSILVVVLVSGGCHAMKYRSFGRVDDLTSSTNKGYVEFIAANGGPPLHTCKLDEGKKVTRRVGTFGKKAGYWELSAEHNECYEHLRFADAPGEYWFEIGWSTQQGYQAGYLRVPIQAGMITPVVFKHTEASGKHVSSGVVGTPVPYQDDPLAGEVDKYVK